MASPVDQVRHHAWGISRDFWPPLWTTVVWLRALVL